MLHVEFLGGVYCMSFDRLGVISFTPVQTEQTSCV